MGAQWKENVGGVGGCVSGEERRPASLAGGCWEHWDVLLASPFSCWESETMADDGGLFPKGEILGKCTFLASFP